MLYVLNGRVDCTFPFLFSPGQAFRIEINNARDPDKGKNHIQVGTQVIRFRAFGFTAAGRADINPFYLRTDLQDCRSLPGEKSCLA